MSYPLLFEGAIAENVTMVAVDKDKNSIHAFRWAINHIDNPVIVAVHVKHKNIPHHGTNVFPPDEDDIANVFIPLRLICQNRRVKMREAVIDESDTSKAIVEYAHRNRVHSVVVGAPSSTKNTLAKSIAFNIKNGSKLFKNHDIATTITKLAPEYTSVYIVAKGKILTARPALRPMVALPKQSPTHGRTPSEGGDLSLGKISHTPKRGNSETERSLKGHVGRPSMESYDLSSRGPRSSIDSDENDLSRSNDWGHDIDLSFESDSSQCSDTTRSLRSRREKEEMEAEMKKLRLMLKQTMNMYSSACKEAVSAQNKAKEINQWKEEESKKVEEARLAEEAALALAEQEKAKAKAALEAAAEAKRRAEIEAQKRLDAEIKAKRETEEKNRALKDLILENIRYRKYTIEELETATDGFSLTMKIGEGGYGPVFKGQLDHTPVAIKILSPDAAQGRRQFQQEVEVLCNIRHPNMVLLLGACPDYGCLVYEYMDNGNLEERLLRKRNTPPIPWMKRFEIAAEISTALLFLHQTKPEPIVHRDLKPANILLNKNFVSKISDVGLSRLVPPSVADSVTQFYMTSAAGTFCYIDPEYQQTGLLTTKSDIYSLGIMLLQIITAKPPMGIAHHVKKAIENGKLNDMLDPAVPDWPLEQALDFAKLALRCVELRKKDRPDLGTVIVPELNRLREFGYALLMDNNNQNNYNYMSRPPTTPTPPTSPLKGIHK